MRVPNLVLKTLYSAEDMCDAVVDFSRKNEEFLPKEYWEVKEVRMREIMRALDWEWKNADWDDREDTKRVFELTKGVLREASSTLAKLKALVSAYKQEIEYCVFA
jgi:DNA topoisomerase IA